MKTVNDYTKYGVGTVTDKLFKMADGFLFSHFEMESLLHLQNGLIWLYTDVWNVGVNHQTEEIENEICGLAQRRIGCEAVLLELQVQW